MFFLAIPVMINAVMKAMLMTIPTVPMSMRLFAKTPQMESNNAMEMAVISSVGWSMRAEKGIMLTEINAIPTNSAMIALKIMGYRKLHVRSIVKK